MCIYKYIYIYVYLYISPMECPTPGARIYYEDTGSFPNVTSRVYEEPIRYKPVMTVFYGCQANSAHIRQSRQKRKMQGKMERTRARALQIPKFWPFFFGWPR